MTTDNSEREHKSVAWTKVAGPTEGKTGIRFEWSVTIRDDNPDKLIQELRNVEQKLMKAGCIPMDAYVDQRKATREQSKQSNVTPPIKASNGHPPTTTQQTDLSFDASLLVGSMANGKTYWKVQGGQFSQFGVTIWPEVLVEAGFFVDDLDPAQTYNLDGYIAHYVLNDKSKPSKIVKLSK